MSVFLAILFVLIGYFSGAVPTGLLVARVRGVDIRALGSGNIGATNVLRSMGVAPAILVALVDPVKGAAATLLPLAFGMPDWMVAITGLAAVLGNDFNLFLGFRGGKGIATTAGVFLVVSPWVALGGLFIGLFTIALGRLVSLGSLVAVISVPTFMIVAGDIQNSAFGLALALMVIAFYKHRDNVLRLANGSERRLGESTR